MQFPHLRNQQSALIIVNYKVGDLPALFVGEVLMGRKVFLIASIYTVLLFPKHRILPIMIGQ